MKKLLKSILCLGLSAILVLPAGVSVSAEEEAVPFSGTVKITYMCGSKGTVAGGNTRTLTQDAGRLCVLPVPAMTESGKGYEFDHWEWTGKTVNELTEFNKDVTLVAAYKELPEIHYTDVSKSSWFYDTARYCYAKKLITGTGDGSKFEPAKNVTRGMIATILYRLEGEPVSYNMNIFPDVKDGAWYQEAVCWATGVGIVKGYADGTFGPDKPATRQEVALFLYRYANYRAMVGGDMDGNYSYPDWNSTSDWAKDAVGWVLTKGVITGKKMSNGKDGICPLEKATRAEFGTMLMRFIRLQEGQLTFYSNDVLRAIIPEQWQGNLSVYTYTNNTDNEIPEANKHEDLRFYDKQIGLTTEMGQIAAVCAYHGNGYKSTYYDYTYCCDLVENNSNKIKRYVVIFPEVAEWRYPSSISNAWKIRYNYLFNNLGKIRISSEHDSWIAVFG